MNQNQNRYLKEAKKFFKFAKREYELAKETKNELKARQAAEKGYLCLLKTVDALFVKNGMEEEKLPKGERGRLYFLSKYGGKDITRIYEAIRHAFHIDAFHEGLINYKILQQRFEDLEELISKIER